MAFLLLRCSLTTLRPRPRGDTSRARHEMMGDARGHAEVALGTNDGISLGSFFRIWCVVFAGWGLSRSHGNEAGSDCPSTRTRGEEEEEGALGTPVGGWLFPVFCMVFVSPQRHTPPKQRWLPCLPYLFLWPRLT